MTTSVTKQVPKWVKPCPRSGAGVHDWAYHTALSLVKNGWDNTEIISHLRDGATRPPNPSNEFETAAERARDWIESGANSPRRPTYEFNAEHARRAAEKGPDDPVNFVRRRSPLDPDSVSLRAFLKALYRPGEKVLLFRDEKSQGVLVSPYEDLEGKIQSFDGSEAGAWFLSNPVTGDWVTKTDGKRSRRSEPCLSAYRYALLESDEVSIETWAAILARFAGGIKSIVHSGGSSLHSLVTVGAESKDHWREITGRLAGTFVPVGADPAALTAVRLTRLPGFMRQGTEQQLLYLNPGDDGTPIHKRKERK